ncbi:unnamed protein product [Lathyrus sativus]|nr:unnamed protein product [Lathyrus sativus]
MKDEQNNEDASWCYDNFVDNSALKSVSKNRTSIFIAHRLTTAMQCVEIIVLENGKVVEHGPHEMLLENAGRYAQLWGQQNNSIDTIDAAIKLGA